MKKIKIRAIDNSAIVVVVVIDHHHLLFTCWGNWNDSFDDNASYLKGSLFSLQKRHWRSYWWWPICTLDKLCGKYGRGLDTEEYLLHIQRTRNLSWPDFFESISVCVGLNNWWKQNYLRFELMQIC